ncbi:MAG: hypothetical protein J6Y77_06890 [Paludibacteraceae bacterium]|nr:hypothetical protein [Paludibacteraceae bacterium]
MKRALSYVLLLLILTACDSTVNWNPKGTETAFSPFNVSIFCEALDSAGYEVRHLSNVYNKDLYFDEPEKTLIIWRFGGDSVPTDRHLQWMDELYQEGYSILIATDSFPGMITEGPRFCIDSLVAETEKYGEFHRMRDLSNLGTFPYVLCSAGGITRFAFEKIPTVAHDTLLTLTDVSWTEGNHGIITIFNENRKIGICTTPLLFTNYGILYDHDFSENLLENLFQEQYPDIRNILYLTTVESQQVLYDCHYKNRKADDRYPVKYEKTTSGRRNLVKRTIHILEAVLFVLFLLFFSRRRQRMIPVIEAPRNRTLDFARQAATVYLENQDYPSILRRYKAVLQNEALNRAHIRLSSTDTTDEDMHRLSDCTGIPERKLRWTLECIDGEITGSRELTLENLITRINEIQSIINKLKE